MHEEPETIPLAQAMAEVKARRKRFEDSFIVHIDEDDLGDIEFVEIRPKRPAWLRKETDDE